MVSISLQPESGYVFLVVAGTAILNLYQMMKVNIAIDFIAWSLLRSLLTGWRGQEEIWSPLSSNVQRQTAGLQLLSGEGGGDIYLTFSLNSS